MEWWERTTLTTQTEAFLDNFTEAPRDEVKKAMLAARKETLGWKDMTMTPAETMEAVYFKIDRKWQMEFVNDLMQFLPDAGRKLTEEHPELVNKIIQEAEDKKKFRMN